MSNIRIQNPSYNWLRAVWYVIRTGGDVQNLLAPSGGCNNHHDNNDMISRQQRSIAYGVIREENNFISLPRLVDSSDLVCSIGSSRHRTCNNDNFSLRGGTNVKLSGVRIEEVGQAGGFAAKPFQTGTFDFIDEIRSAKDDQEDKEKVSRNGTRIEDEQEIVSPVDSTKRTS